MSSIHPQTPQVVWHPYHPNTIFADGFLGVAFCVLQDDESLSHLGQTLFPAWCLPIQNIHPPLRLICSTTTPPTPLSSFYSYSSTDSYVNPLFFAALLHFLSPHRLGSVQPPDRETSHRWRSPTAEYLQMIMSMRRRMLNRWKCAIFDFLRKKWSRFE